MSDNWNDATQSYENENSSSTQIINEDNSDLLTPPLNNETNNLIKLVEVDGLNQLYIIQANEEGEIRFITADAKNNNNQEGLLLYNTKIGADGKLYFYHSYTIFNLAKLSGWYDIGKNINDIEIQNIIQDALIGGLTISVGTILNDISVVQVDLAGVNIVQELQTLQIEQTFIRLKVLEARTGYDDYDYDEITQELYEEALEEFYEIAENHIPNSVWTYAQQRARMSWSGKISNILYKVLTDTATGLAVLGFGTAVVAGIRAIIDNSKEEEYKKEIINITNALNLRTISTDLTTLNHTGITIVSGNTGFATPNTKYSVEIQKDTILLISINATPIASVELVERVGLTDFTIGETITIPKASLGGGTGGNLLLSVASLGTFQAWADYRTTYLLSKTDGLQVKSRRKQGVIGADDIDTTQFTTTNVSYTDTTDTTTETITYKQLKSRLNLLPTGGGDVDIYTATGSLGIGTTPLTNLDTFHATDNILRLGTAISGQNSIEFKRGTDIDTGTDYRLIADTGAFRLQYQDASLTYGDTGTNIFWGSKTYFLIFKDTEYQAKVGVGTTPSTDAGITLHTYHPTSQIMRLETADTGTTELQFTRGAVADAETDYRFISDTDDAFKLQYRDDVVSYTNLINIIPTEINLLKNTKITGNVGIGTSPATALHTYGATTNTLLLETGATGLPIIEFRKATTTDIYTDYRFISDAGGIFKFQFNNNLTAFGASANASDIWNARVDRMVIYKNTTITANCGIGGANPHATYKLNVGGDVNIPTGSAYRIGTNPLSYNDLADQLVSGANITIDGNVINCVPPNTLAEDIDGIIPVEHGGTGRNDIGMYAIPFGNADETTYTWTGNFKYNQALGRLGVGIMTPEYALDVNGDMNIPATSNYRIGGNPLSYNDLADKLTAGTNIDITSGIISANVPAQLTAGTGITITSGAINATTQLTAGTNIDITSGVISANVPAQLTAGTNITITSGAINAVVPTTFDAGAITSGTLALSRGGTGTTTIGKGAIPFGNSLQNGYTWTNLFKFDEVNTRVGINKSTPLYTLDVGGDINIPTGTFYRVNGTALTFTNLSGTCPVSKGGTGLSVASSGAIIFGNITSDAYSYRVVFNWDDVNLRLGVNKILPAYTIDSGGDINIATGSTYRIGGTALSYNNLTNKLTAGTNVEITAGNVVNVSVVSISASAITSGTLGVARGGTGNATFTAGNILYGNDALAIGNNTGFKYLSGRLGVNMVGTPVATLHIGTGATATGGTYYVWFDYFSGSSLGFTNFNRTDVCAYLQGSLWLAGGRFIASSSDVRIKQEIEDINDDSALQMILAVEPKTYKYIDKPTLGDKRVYGFIAQQIKEVIPQAINLQKETIPNILLLATYNDGIITLPSQPPSVVIKVGDKLRCYDKENKEIIAFVEEIDALTPLTFKIAPLEEPYTDTRIFIYGTEIDDFHTIDKNYIYTLNVCATQELHRKIVSQEQRIAELEAKVERLLNYLT